MRSFCLHFWFPVTYNIGIEKGFAMNTIEVFEDTMTCIRNGGYPYAGQNIPFDYTMEEMQEAKVLLPDVVRILMSKPPMKGKKRDGNILCENIDSFSAARQLKEVCQPSQKDVLVLNFASPIHPGGGVKKGARAQEEDLCRMSTLYVSLSGEKAASFYKHNRMVDDSKGSTSMIFSDNVEVFKDETYDYLPAPVRVSVLTCAAPVYRTHNVANPFLYEQKHYQTVYQRIVSMIVCCANFGYENLVLGAWGCGVFGNDAEKMAKLFDRALNGEVKGGHPLRYSFDNIYFAVLDRSKDQYNYNSFKKIF